MVESRGVGEKGGLDRALGLGQVTASGVGIIVGAGIYVLVGEAAALAGPRLWIGFLLAAVLSALTGLSYAELASMFPKAGAEFEYSRHAFPPWVAFLVGWVMFSGLIVAAAAVALGFGRYAGHFVSVSPRVGAWALLCFVGIVALTGIRRSVRLTVVLSLVQVGGLVYVIAIGVPHLGQVDLLSGDGGSGGVLAAAALVFFAFIGFDEVITLAEETRDPTRTLPRALLLALGISTLLYIGVAVAAVSVIGTEALAGSERPLADVLDHVLGGRGADLLAGVALLATMNTTLLCITATSRLQYGMASASALPSALTRLGPRSRAPRAAIGISIVVAAAFVALGDLTLVASVTDLAIYLVFIAVNIAVVVLRFRLPDHPRPFRSPWSIRRVPVLPILGLLAVLVMIPALRWEAIVLGFGLCGIGLVVYALLRRRLASSAGADDPRAGGHEVG
jgi:APA family basic amino acid/polyamine antiporter